MPKRVVVLDHADMGMDKEAAQQILTRASGATLTANRMIEYMETYMRHQDPRLSPADMYEAFVGRLSHGLMPSTLSTYVKTMKSYGIYPGQLDLARARVRRTQLLNGIKRMEEEAPLAGDRGEESLEVLREIIVRRFERDTAQDLEYRAIFFVLVATGARPENLMVAQSCSVDQKRQGVVIQWGRRKVRPPSRASLLYPFSWSTEPPADVVERIAALPTRPWGLAGSSNPASAICAWLRKRLAALGMTCRVTSTTPRGRLSRVVYEEFEAGRMSAERFGDLLDHEPSMSRTRYQTGVI